MENGTALIHFPSVYIHQSEGRLFEDAGTGWTQEAVLRITDAQVDGAFSAALQVWGGDIVYLSDGSLRMGDVISDNLIPIPLRITTDIQLKLESCGETVEVRGTSAHLELIGEPKYVEEFPPKR
ncbi:MAG: hypothetical protein ABR920_06290 [Terriglobales bacterium]